MAGRSPSGRATRPADQAAARLGDTASVPNAGEVYRIRYPFVRDTYSGFDGVDGYADFPTWKPGIRYVSLPPYGEDSGSVADALGEAVFTVEAVFKPGRFPTRVFFTRQFINPDGKQFGKGKLHIATLAKFRRLTKGYQHPFGIGEPLPSSCWNAREAREAFERMLAEHVAKEAVQ